MSDPSETPAQRRKRYLRLADEAEAMAEQCKSLDVREAYLALAQSWTLLANDVRGVPDEDA